MIFIPPQDVLFSAAVFTTHAAAALKNGTVHLNPLSLVPYLENVVDYLLKFDSDAAVKLLVEYLTFAHQLTKSARADHVSIERVAQRFTGIYGAFAGERYDSLVISPPNGCIPYLCAYTRSLYLPTQFFIPRLHLGDPDDVFSYQQKAQRFSARLLAENDGIEVINHYDPVHDRFNVRRVIHVRPKLQALPEEYKRFMRAQLRSDATVLYIENTQPWKQYVIDENLYFQLGGCDGIKFEEYRDKSERIAKWMEMQGVGTFDWSLDCDEEQRNESEWGSPVGLEQRVREFCAEEGFKFEKMRIDNAMRLNEITMAAAMKLYPARGVAVEQYWNVCPCAVTNMGLVPLWLSYNGDESLEYCRRYLEQAFRRLERLPVYFGMIPTMVKAPDYVGLAEWRSVAEEYGSVSMPGVNERFYPADPSCVSRYSKAMHWLARKYRQQCPIMPASEIVALAKTALR